LRQRAPGLSAVRRHVTLSVVLATLLPACGGAGDDRVQRPAVQDAGPVHVHALGVDTRDGTLFIATHTGLFRAAADETRAHRVAGRYQDTMGFTVVDPDRFFASGHPDGRERLPPFLGLIESRDAGATWRPVSLLGKVDFHLLETIGDRVYGFGTDFETRREQLLASADGGRTWARRVAPGSLESLAVHPAEPNHLVATSRRALHRSLDGGRSWRRGRSSRGLLAWPTTDRLYLLTAGGEARRSRDAGRTWRRVGFVGGAPSALDAPGSLELYVALHDGTVKRSTDGGATWSVRSRP
jgi:hypothetical protein